MIFFSKNLKYLRTKKGLKQSELAEKVGVRTNTISNYENNISEPDFKILDLISHELNINVSVFLFTDLSGNNYPDDKEIPSIAEEQKSDSYNNPGSSQCVNCIDKERIIQAQQILIKELQEEKSYLRDEIKSLKDKLGG